MNELEQTIKEHIHYHNHKTVLKNHTPIEYRNMVIKTIYPQFLVHIKNVRYSYLIILISVLF